MNVKDTARKQYAGIVDSAAHGKTHRLEGPAEGWLATFRQALGMSQADVAARLGVGRASIQQAERRESSGSITLDSMARIASAMGGRVVYAVIPEESPGKGVSDLIDDQAHAKASAIIRYASTHMALENQALTPGQNRKKTKQLAAELAGTMPRGFWRDM